MKLLLSSALLIASAYSDPAFNQCVLDCVNDNCTPFCDPSVVDQCIQTCENGDVGNQNDNDDGIADNPNADDTIPDAPNDDSDDGLDTDDTANNPSDDDNDTSPDVPQDWLELCVFNCVNNDYTPFVIEECTSRCENGEPANYDDVIANSDPETFPDYPRGWYDDEVFGPNCFENCINNDYSPEHIQQCYDSCGIGEQGNDDESVNNPNADDTLSNTPQVSFDECFSDCVDYDYTPEIVEACSEQCFGEQENGDDTVNNPDDNNDDDTPSGVPPGRPPLNPHSQCVYDCANHDYRPFVIEECNTRCLNGEPANYDDIVNPDVPPDDTEQPGYYYTFGIRESSASSNSGNTRRLRGIKTAVI